MTVVILLGTALLGCHDGRSSRLEFEAQASSADGQLDLDDTIRVVRDRLDTIDATAVVRSLGNDRIEVVVQSVDANTIELVEQVVVRPGTLEFAIVAHRSKDSKLAGRASTADSLALYEEEDGQRVAVAEWLPVNPTRELATHGGIVSRSGDTSKGIEFLVLYETPDLRVTGDDLVSVRQSRDPHRGTPVIDFELSEAGGRRMEALTRKYTMDSRADEPRRLAIVIDGQIHAAPGLQAVIVSRGQITGIEDEDLESLLPALRSGSLPARLSLVVVETITP